jgi:hypothetical protein
MRVAQLRSGFFEFFALRQGWAETGSQLRWDPIVSGRSERFARSCFKTGYKGMILQ